jgi:hypothetical protein
MEPVEPKMTIFFTLFSIPERLARGDENNSHFNGFGIWTLKCGSLVCRQGCLRRSCANSCLKNQRIGVIFKSFFL